MSTPLVYGEHGEVLGIDYRQSPLAAPEMRVPGRIPITGVLPGDRVRVNTAGDTVTVLRVRGGDLPADMLHVICRTEQGAEVAFELAPFAHVEVVSMGAFTQAGVA